MTKHQKILIIAPHPDDELIGCGSTYLNAVKNKESIKIVYLTNGSLKTEPKIKSSLRKKAVLQIAKEHGLKKNDQILLDFYERSLTNKSNAIKCFQLLKKIIKDYKPTEIYVTAYEGGHIDHDIANLLIAKIKTKAKKYEYAVYNNYFSLKKVAQIALREAVKKASRKYFYWDTTQFIPKETKPFFATESREEIKQKNAIIRKYQMLAEKPLDRKEPRVQLNNFKADLLRIQPNHDYSKKPHKGPLPLNYEMAFKVPFSEFRKIMNIIS